MDSQTAVAPVFSFLQPSWLRALIAVGLIAYAAFLAYYVGADAGGSDSAGYLNNARLLSAVKTSVPQRIPAGIDAVEFDAFTFIPLGFRPLPETREMVPTYPIGLPIGVLALAKVVGWQLAPPILMVASALVAVALMLPLGRVAGLPLSWSAFGALLLATNPLTTFMSVQFMSDVPATAVTIATILGAWRSRSHRGWAALAGFVFAIGVLIRPTDLLLLIPCALCLGLDWRRWLLFGLGGVPGAIAQCVYSTLAYGNPLASGYGGELGTKFSLGIVPTTLSHYLQWLPVLLTPLVFLVLIFPWLARREPFAWVLISWIIVFFGFYVGYWHTHETWWYLRFLLPAFPACIVGSLWGGRWVWLRFGPSFLKAPLPQLALALVLITGVMFQSVHWHHRLTAALIGRSESVYPKTFAWAKAHLPADAIIVAMQTTGALVYYTDYQFARWDALSEETFAHLAAAASAQHRPLFAVLFPFEIKDALEIHAPGQWKQTGTVGAVSIWQWSALSSATGKN